MYKRNYMKRIFQKLTLTLLIAGLLFYSCKKEINKSPIAVAGPDQTISLPTNSVFLDGSASNDPDGSITTWQWSKVAGPSSFTIANTGIAKTHVNSLVGGTYLFELKVTDAGGLTDRDTMQVIVDDQNVNQPPVANAGTDTAITLPANTVMLDGSSSADPNNNITSYQWTKISGPFFSTIANASGAITAASSLTAGIYLFELKVTDAGGLFDRDTVQITVLSSTFNGSGVYIAGWGWNASGKMVARVWRENILQDLSDGQYDADALSVFVSGNDIYVGGHERNASGKSVAKLWKNGVSQNLSNGQYDAVAKSVFVSGTDVYVAGWEVNTSGNSVAKLWKNGVPQNLSDGLHAARANSVFVSGSDVYVAGIDWYNAELWKNGVKQSFSNGQSDAEAYSVFVSGNDVFMAGGGYWGIPGFDPTLWKNGQLQSLEWQGDHIGSAVFVSGSDVYVTGASGAAILWKNGMAQLIGQSNDVANSVFVSGNDVYVVGNKYNYNGTASLWKNGVAYSTPDLNAANSVYVQ